MKIYYLVSDFSASGSYRAIFPGEALRGRGHRCYMPPIASKKVQQLDDGREFMFIGFKPGVIKQHVLHTDLLVIQRPVDERFALPWARRARANDIPLTSDTDDLYLSLDPEHPSSERGLEQAFLSVFKLCDLVTVSTPTLAEAYAPYLHKHTEIRVIRNALYPRMWENVTPQYEVERPKVRIGYLGEMRFHGHDLAEIKDVITPFIRTHPEVEFVAIGDAAKAKLTVCDYLEIPSEQRVEIPFVDFRQLPEVLGSFDIGLIPLKPTLFNRAKSFLKGIEYSICGIVPVASAWGEYYELIEDGYNGFLCHTPDEWRNVLEALVREDGFRRGVAKQAREHVFEFHTIDTRVAEWEDAYVRFAPAEPSVGLLARAMGG